MSPDFEIYRPNPQLDSPFNGWTLLHLEGNDATDFLHRLTTVPVQRMEPGRGQEGFFLDAQGKIQSWFYLWRLGENEYLFELDGGINGSKKEKLKGLIDHYTFSEDIRVADPLPDLKSRQSLDCVFLFPLEEHFERLSSISPFETLVLDEEIRIMHHGDDTFGRPWISAWGHSGRLLQWHELFAPGRPPLLASQLEQWRIQQNFPAMDGEMTEDTNPLEVGRVNAVSGPKGCFPGQEVIEKILTRGSPARRLVQLKGEGETPVVGTPLLNEAVPPVEVGKVTSTVSIDGAQWVLALVRKIQAKEGLELHWTGGKGQIQKVSETGK